MNEINEKDDSLVYEVGFHLLPTVEESDVPVEAAKIRSIIEENGGAIISEEAPKMIVIAYDISKNINSKRQKFNKAYFGWIKFEIDPSQISQVKSKIENVANILRFVIIKTVKEDTMHIHKAPMFRKEDNKEEKGETQTEKPKASEAEIDKSIDELVIENN